MWYTWKDFVTIFPIWKKKQINMDPKWNYFHNLDHNLKKKQINMDPNLEKYGITFTSIIGLVY